MNTGFARYRPLVISSIFMVAGVIAAYPLFKYNIDPDSVAYLSIAKRYANGEYSSAINAYWSPLASWLTALLLKINVRDVSAAILVNTLAAIGALIIGHSLFVFYAIEERLRRVMTLGLALFLIYAVYWQWFDDLWQCFLLLLILRVLVSERYTSRPTLWVLNGLLAALAYYAKAYSLSFFVLSSAVSLWFICRDNAGTTKCILWFKICSVSIGVMLMCCMPWFVLLHSKYGIWTTSSAVALNGSWSLLGHPIWKEGVGALLPPINGAATYWEDPFWVNGPTPHFWNSAYLFALQIGRSTYMLFRLLGHMTDMSCFFIPSWFMAFGIVFSKKIKAQFPALFIPATCFLLYPIGLLFINSESRYIWYMMPLSMIFSALALQKFLLPVLNKGLSRFAAILFVLSFLITPCLNLKSILKEGKPDFATAETLASLHIDGSFTSNAALGPESQSATRLAYLSGSSYYNIPELSVSHEEVLKEIRRYHVKYYFYYCKPVDGDNYIFPDEQGRPLPELSKGSIPGLKIFYMNPGQ